MKLESFHPKIIGYFNWLAPAASTMSSIAVLIGIPLFFYQQFIDERRTQFLNTIDVISEFQSSDMLAHRLQLLKSWDAYAGRMPNNVPRILVDKMVSDLIDSSEINKDQIMSAVFHVAEFYNGLARCVEISACDEKTALEYFHEEAQRFYCLYRSVLENWEIALNMKDFSLGVIRFVGDRAAC